MIIYSLINMSIKIYNDNCFNIFDEINANYVNLVCVDLPYNCTDNEWDKKINLEEMWRHLLRICKKNCTYIFFCNTKYGAELINSKPNFYKYDLVWVKKNSVGWLSCKKKPLPKHEMIYVFKANNFKDKEQNKELREYSKKIFDKIKIKYKKIKEMKGDNTLRTFYYNNQINFSIPKKENYEWLISKFYIDEYKFFKTYEEAVKLYTSNKPIYNPQMLKREKKVYDRRTENYTDKNYGSNRLLKLNIYTDKYPTSILEYGYDKKSFHPTQKPLKLLEWIIKTYSNTGEVVLDFTMGSGSTGVACINTERRFIGVEMNEEIFKTARNRIIETEINKKYT